MNNSDYEITGDFSEKTWPKFGENYTYQGVCNICKKGGIFEQHDILYKSNP